MILSLLGRISSGEGDGIFEKENQDLKKMWWEKYQVVGNLIPFILLILEYLGLKVINVGPNHEHLDYLKEYFPNIEIKDHWHDPYVWVWA